MYLTAWPRHIDGRNKQFGKRRLFRGGMTSPLWQALLSLTCALSCPNVSHAEGAWSLAPSVRAEGSYDDNASLNATTPNGISWLRLSTAVELARLRPNGELRGVLGVDVVDYTGKDAPSEEGNQFIEIGGLQRARRSNWRLNANLKRDSLLRTVELPPQPSADVPIGDANVALVTVPVRRNRLLLAPSWEYDLTRLDNLRLGYDLTAERFEKTAADVVDYNSHALTAEVGHRLSLKDLVRAKVRAQRFEPDNRQAVETYELLADLNHSYSPVGNVGIEVGARWETGDEVDDTTGFVVGLSWNGTTPLATTLVKLERRLYPNGFGELEETEQILANWTRQLSRTTQLLMKGRAFDAKSISFDSPNDREYAQLDAELRHAFDRWWSAGVAYRYRWIHRESDTKSATSNGIFVSINYDKPLMLE